MKKLFLSSLCVFGLTCGTQRVLASHAAGMDLTYECVGADQYLFIVTFYRDCIGIAAPPSMNLQFSSTCGYSNNVSANLVYSTQGSDTISHLAGLCPGLESQCVNIGSNYTGYEQYIYTALVTLSQPCTDYTIGVAESARNAAITNLQDPSSYDLYVECHLDNTLSVCDNSPVFSNIPLAYSCTDQLFSYNHGALDPDGDSLAYELVQPLGGPGNPIPYATGSGFSATYPLSTTTGTFDFNPVTGQMSCTPNANQIAVISVRIDEFRGGVKIGSTQRDLQVVIQACADIVPVIDGITNVNGGVQIDSNTVDVCPGALVSFDIVGHDANSNQIVMMTTNLSATIPGATFDTTGSNPQTGTFTWQTQISDSGFYVFSVTIRDNACPIAGQQVYSFTVDVIATPVNAGPDTAICASNPIIQLNANGTPPFEWNQNGYLNNASIANPVATLPGPGTYQFIVTADTGGYCERSDTVNVTVTPSVAPTAQVNPDTVCSGQPVTLTSGATGGTGSYTYSWSSIPPGFTSGQQDTTASPVVPTIYIVTVHSGGCNTNDSLVVFTLPLPDDSISIIPNTVCANSPVVINYAGAGGPGYTYSWDFGGGNVLSGSGSGPYSVDWTTGGTQSVSLTVTDLNTCSDTRTIDVTVNPTPDVSFTANAGGCAPLTVNFQNTSTLGVNYIWDFGDGSTSTLESPTHTYNAGTFSVTLIVFTALGCSDTLFLPNYITVLPDPIASFNITEPITSPVDVSQATFHFNNTSQNATTYEWIFGDGSTSSETDPVYSYTTLDTFYVTLIASNAYCSDTFTLGPIIVVSYNEIYFPSAFSPNGDGTNDEFHELGQNGIVTLTYSVYNRWGQMVFETSDINGRWDGTYQGTPAEVGVYVWVAKATMINGDLLSRRGNVTLIR